MIRNERFDCVKCGKQNSVESLDHVLCPACLKEVIAEQEELWASSLTEEEKNFLSSNPGHTIGDMVLLNDEEVK